MLHDTQKIGTWRQKTSNALNRHLSSIKPLANHISRKTMYLRVKRVSAEIRLQEQYFDKAI